MRRQLSDSAVISTGKPERVYTKVTSWSRVGPPRTLTRSGLRLTKRGTGKPLLGPALISPAARTGAAQASAAATTRAPVHKHQTICKLSLELIGPDAKRRDGGVCPAKAIPTVPPAQALVFKPPSVTEGSL